MIHHDLIDHVDLESNRVHSPRVHTEDLAAACDEYARFFDALDDVPRHVITQGLGTIGDAAAADLRLADHDRQTYRNKPTWQPL